MIELDKQSSEDEMLNQEILLEIKPKCEKIIEKEINMAELMQEKIGELNEQEKLDFKDWSKDSFEKILYRKFKHLSFWPFQYEAIHNILN